MVDAAMMANCSPVIVVAGSGIDGILGELAETNTSVVANTNWRLGIGTSIRTGVRHLIDNHPEVGAVVLLVCDQPFVDCDVVNRLIALRNETGKPIVASSYADTLGVPALFDRSCFDELLALDQDQGAKSIILSNRARVTELPFPKGNVDIDTHEDWERLTERPQRTPPR